VASVSTQVGVARAAVTAEKWFQQCEEALKEGTRFDEALAQRGKAILEDASVPAPAKRQEPWRYTDLKALFETEDESASSSVEPTDEAMKALLDDFEAEDGGATWWQLVFVDGVFSEAWSRLPDAEDAPLVASTTSLKDGSGEKQRVSKLLEELPEVDVFMPEQRGSMGSAKFAALNQAVFNDCACIVCPSADASASPTNAQVVYVSTGNGRAITSPRVVVDAGAGSQLNLVELHLSSEKQDTSFSNGLVRVVLEEGAKVSHTLLQQKSEDSRFVQTVTSEVANNASYDLQVLQSGARVSRVNASVELQGESSACDVSGVTVAAAQQQLDLHTLIHHRVPGCNSNQRQRNIAGGNGECIFKGAICVDKVAQQTESSQICRSLLLSKKSQVKAMPCLQIQADDVSCSHGATISELDPQEVFYLTSRGLDPKQARNLLLMAYPQDIVASVKSRTPKGYQRLLDKLGALADEATAA